MEGFSKKRNKEKKLTGMDNSVVIARVEGEVEEGVGDKWGWKETWPRVVNTQYSEQMMYCGIVNLKPT